MINPKLTSDIIIVGLYKWKSNKTIQCVQNVKKPARICRHAHVDNKHAENAHFGAATFAKLHSVQSLAKAPLTCQITFAVTVAVGFAVIETSLLNARRVVETFAAISMDVRYKCISHIHHVFCLGQVQLVSAL